MFKSGDKAVYPAHGVGVVERIEKKEIAGTSYQFYILRIIENDMTIMIPTSNVEAVGLRRIIASNQVPKVYKILRQVEISVDAATWNRRYREYMEKIKTGSAFEIAQVLRDLYILKNDKDLSFGERKMLETARTLLVKELAIAKGAKEEDVAKQLDKVLLKTAEVAAATGTKRRKSKPSSVPSKKLLSSSSSSSSSGSSRPAAAGGSRA